MRLRAAFLPLAFAGCGPGPPSFTEWQPLATCLPVVSATVDVLGREGIEARACTPPGPGSTVNLLSDDTASWPVVGAMSLETPVADTVWLDGFMPLRLGAESRVRWLIEPGGFATGFIYSVRTHDAVSLAPADAAVALRLAPAPACVTAVSVLFPDAEASLLNGAACLDSSTH